MPEELYRLPYIFIYHGTSFLFQKLNPAYTRTVPKCISEERNFFR